MKPPIRAIGLRKLSWLPDRRGIIKAQQAKESIDRFINLLAGRARKTARIEEMNEALARAWAGKK